MLSLVLTVPYYVQCSDITDGPQGGVREVANGAMSVLFCRTGENGSDSQKKRNQKISIKGKKEKRNHLPFCGFHCESLPPANFLLFTGSELSMIRESLYSIV